MTQEECDALNVAIAAECAEEEIGAPDWQFAPSKLGDTHVAIVDPEWDWAHIDDVRVELVRAAPRELLNTIKRNRDRAYDRGEAQGHSDAKFAMRRALGLQ